ncbi:hypothetical protein [Methanobacterium bryantii]|uniref:Uncharacterized protein n=1 Tax=Methanobacterium bryantii TaxID=2161 RepID=A0A2A2H861_METBR|nr:hypothetical protein [Methanobacterium bryantii]PAV05460.1 hypothetical protein ASJ80_09435 [Methanobacterium bryantii]
MVSEVRFRDILCHDSNLDLLSKEIGRITGKDLKLNLISKELPLPFDVVGLQMKFCDIVGFDEENNVYIIELKRRINERGLKKVENQVQEYIDTFNKALFFIKSGKPLFFYHFILVRYFEFINFDYNKMRKIIPVIVSIEVMDEITIQKCSFHCGFLDSKTKKDLLENFIKNKRLHFIKAYNNLFSKLEINTDISKILNYAIKKGNIDTSLWFPVVLNKINSVENSNSILDSYNPESASYSYQLIFENVNNYNKEFIDVTKCYESFLDADFIQRIKKEGISIYNQFSGKNDNVSNVSSIEHSIIPESYFQFKPLEIFEKVYMAYHEAKSDSKALKFTIQIFRSGRTVPIIYLQIFENVFLPLIQVKPVVFSIGPCVNHIIAYDMKEQFKEYKDCFYEDVISLDTGNYEISRVESEGVSFYKITLKGQRNIYEFFVYSPKIRAVDELLPFMSPKKVKGEIDSITKNKGEMYLFKVNGDDSAEWITSKIHINS